MFARQHGTGDEPFRLRHSPAASPCHLEHSTPPQLGNVTRTFSAVSDVILESWKCHCVTLVCVCVYCSRYASRRQPYQSHTDSPSSSSRQCSQSHKLKPLCHTVSVMTSPFGHRRISASMIWFSMAVVLSRVSSNVIVLPLCVCVCVCWSPRRPD